MTRSYRWVKMGFIVIVALFPAFILGCGGGGGKTTRSATDRPTTGAVVQRSLRIHNYNNWSFPNDTPANMEKMLSVLAKRDNICFGECYEHANSLEGWRKLSVQSIKAINPSAKVYRLYNMMAKASWELDWIDPSDTRRMANPVEKRTIEARDWWLRDSDGEIIKENDGTWLIDVSKDGYKEAFLQGCLDRNRGKGFDGFVFDYIPMDFSLAYLRGYSKISNFSSDAEYLEKAVKPFINYVVDGLHAAGYRVIGNCIGRSDDSRPACLFLRSKMDGVIYEQNLFSENGDWIPNGWLESRLRSLINDPLEVWYGENGLKNTCEDFDRKQIIALSAYYLSIPASQEKRSYHCAYNWTPHWQPIWDLNIGTPSGPAEKLPGQHFWFRRFSQGIVLLNYETNTTTYTLDKKYHDVASKEYSGSIELPARSALILGVCD